MLTTSEAVNEIAAALAKAQGQMSNAAKDRKNPHFQSSYATLASVRDTVIEPLAANGIACVQAAATDEHGVTVETRLVHASGQWMASTVAAKPKSYAPQDIGSAITYLRRYSLMALCGIAPADDDGNGTGDGGKAPEGVAWQSQRREPPPRGEGHDASFTDHDRRSFMAALSERGIKYDDLKAFCAAAGRPKPSEMGIDGRQKIIAYLDTAAGKARLDTFIHTGTLEAK
jgi:hypothetical protein